MQLWLHLPVVYGNVGHDFLRLLSLVFSITSISFMIVL